MSRQDVSRFNDWAFKEFNGIVAEWCAVSVLEALNASGLWRGLSTFAIGGTDAGTILNWVWALDTLFFAYAAVVYLRRRRSARGKSRTAHRK